MFFASGEDDVKRNKYELIVEGARFGDRNGFSTVWVPERHFTPMGCLYPNPAVLHAALARETAQIRLNAGSVVAALHHPLRIAEEWSLVDNLSDGRIGLSFVSGWNPTDFAFFPERYAQRHQEMYRAIDTVQRLWRGESIDITDGNGRPAQVRTYPTPLQKELPFWVTAAASSETFRRAGEVGGNLLTHMMDCSVEQLAEKIAIYRQGRAQGGHDAAAGEVSLMLHTFVGPDLEEVHGKIRQPYCQYLKANKGLVKGFAGSRGREVDLDQLSAQELDDFYHFLYDRFATSRGLIGTPESCQPLLAQLAGIGVTEIACLLDFGASAELIADHLPYLLQLKERYAALNADKAPPTPTLFSASPKAADAASTPPPETVEATERTPAQTLPREAIRSRCAERIPGERFYDDLQEHGVTLDSSFRGVEEIWRGDREALARVTLPAALNGATAGYGVHPAFLDACIQVVTATLPREGPLDGAIYLPTGLRRMRMHRPLDARIWSHVRLHDSDGERVEGDIALYDDDGELVAQLSGFRMQRIQSQALHPTAGDDPAQAAWREWLYRVSWQPRPSWHRSPDERPPLDALRRRLAEKSTQLLATATGLPEQEEALRRLEEVSLHYVLQAFAASGLALQVGERWSTAQLAQRLELLPQYRRLLDRLLEMLAEGGIVAEREGVWQVVATPPDEPPAPLIAALQASYGEVAGACLTLLERCAAPLGAVLRGEQDPVALLFPDGDATTVTQLYQELPAARVMNALVLESVLDAVEHLPAGRGLRILEVGAGTGGTTSWLLPHLPAERTEYLFTDVGALFTAKAQGRFADYDFIHYRTLDIERSPADQGFPAQQYDIVIAANVLHATCDLRESLAHIRQLLTPGGELILLEATGRKRWLDLTFGLTDGWWRFDDERDHHPLLTTEEWQALLGECGFPEVAVTPASPQQRQPLGQSVIVARAERSRTAQAQTWLLLRDEQGLGEALAALLRERGDRVVEAHAADAYRQIGDDIFHLDPQRADDVRQLLAAIPAPDGVIHLWSLDSPPADAEAELDGVFTRGCGSLLHLTQALTSSRLWVVTRGAQAVADGERLPGVGSAPLWGMARVIAQEHPELGVSCIDLDGAQAAAAQAAALWAEIDTVFPFAPPENQVALRDGRRHVARLTHAPPTAAPTAQALTCHPQGSYLITGGTGGLGLLCARWLVERGARHLLLAARSAPSPEAQRQIDALRDDGATVTVTPLDVSDRRQLARLLAAIDPATPLRGVLHLANVVEIQLLRQQSWERFAKALAAKAAGAWHLHALTRETPLDFWIAFSSMASLLAYRGLAGYGAANAFLDGLAHHRQAQGLPALVVNWGTWSEVGRMAQMIEQSPQRLAAGERVIAPPQGLQALEHLLREGAAQRGVMPIDWAEFLRAQEVKPAFFNELEAAPSAPASSADGAILEQWRLAAADRREGLIQEHLHRSIATVLQLPATERIAPQQALVRLGLDSLMAVEIRNRIRSDLQVEVPFVDFLGGMSLAQLTAIVHGQLNEGPETAPAADPALPPTDGHNHTDETKWVEFTL
ncbi:hypothetical protein JCM17961_18990 [Endothiovibrio diazotrophicus]